MSESIEPRTGLPTRNTRPGYGKPGGSIAVTAADPVAFTRRIIDQGITDVQAVHAAAGRLLALGVSLRRPREGEAVLEFASGTGASTTLRWLKTADGGGLTVDNAGHEYCPPPGMPASVLDGLGVAHQPRVSARAVQDVLASVESNPLWGITGFRTLRLRAQRELASRFRRLQRQLTRWAETRPGDRKSTGVSARYKLRTLGMAALDCQARITAERDDRGNLVHLTIETGPEPDARLQGELTQTIVTPTRRTGVTARWMGNPFDEHGEVVFSDSWMTLTAYWREMTMSQDHPAGTKPWREIMDLIGDHPCWRALKEPDAKDYDDRTWTPWTGNEH